MTQRYNLGSMISSTTPATESNVHSTASRKSSSKSDTAARPSEHPSFRASSAISTEDAASITVSGCDGACFASPTVLVQCRSGDFIRLERVDSSDLRRVGMALRSESLGAPSSATRFIESQRRVTLDGCGWLNAESIDDYLSHGGYSALARALRSDPNDVINQVKDSRLRGRGGAYFPAGLKWESARGFSSDRRYLIVNCEEGEPGLFKDRHLMEGAPHRLIEGACIAAYSCDIQDVIFYHQRGGQPLRLASGERNRAGPEPRIHRR